MTIDPTCGRLTFPELGLALDRGLTRTEFLALPTSAVRLDRVRHDPSFRYQLPALPQATSSLYVVVEFHYERLAAVNLFHHAERFDLAAPDGSTDPEMARKAFHEEWLAAECGVTCQRYRWGEITSRYEPAGRASSIYVEYAKPNAWQVAGRTAGRIWGAAATSRRPG